MEPGANRSIILPVLLAALWAAAASAALGLEESGVAGRSVKSKQSTVKLLSPNKSSAAQRLALAQREERKEKQASKATSLRKRADKKLTAAAQAQESAEKTSRAAVRTDKRAKLRRNRAKERVKKSRESGRVARIAKDRATQDLEKAQSDVTRAKKSSDAVQFKKARTEREKAENAVALATAQVQQYAAIEKKSEIEVGRTNLMLDQARKDNVHAYHVGKWAAATREGSAKAAKKAETDAERAGKVKEKIAVQKFGASEEAAAKKIIKAQVDRKHARNLELTAVGDIYNAKHTKSPLKLMKAKKDRQVALKREKDAAATVERSRKAENKASSQKEVATKKEDKLFASGEARDKGTANELRRLANKERRKGRRIKDQANMEIKAANDAVAKAQAMKEATQKLPQGRGAKEATISFSNKLKAAKQKTKKADKDLLRATAWALKAAKDGKAASKTEIAATKANDEKQAQFKIDVVNAKQAVNDAKKAAIADVKIVEKMRLAAKRADEVSERNSKTQAKKESTARNTNIDKKIAAEKPKVLLRKKGPSPPSKFMKARMKGKLKRAKAEATLAPTNARVASGKSAVPNAKECTRWACSVEDQLCAKGRPGAEKTNMCCKQGGWERSRAASCVLHTVTWFNDVGASDDATLDSASPDPPHHW